MKIWKGDDDYLGYLKTAAGFLPQGAVRGAMTDAIDLTDKARRVGPAVLAAANGDGSAAFAAGQGVVLNAGSRFARERVDKQLAFFETPEPVSHSQVEKRFGKYRPLVEPVDDFSGDSPGTEFVFDEGKERFALSLYFAGQIEESVNLSRVTLRRLIPLAPAVPGGSGGTP